MRILFVSQEYPPSTAKGGVGTQAFMKAKGMAALGHDVVVISRTAGERCEKRDGRIREIRISTASFSAHTEVADWVSYSALVAAEISNVHRDEPVDLVEAPEWACEAYVHLLNRTEWNRIPTVIQLHGPLVMLSKTIGWPDRSTEFFRIGRQMEESCVRLADAVYSSSACSADWCAREYGLVRDQIPVLHTGIDVKHFAPRRNIAKHPRLTIVSVGKVTANKGSIILFDAAARLAEEFPGLRLRMLGHSEKHVVEEMSKRAAASGRENLLELPGFTTREDLPAELCAAHVFALPSRYEGGPGFAYLEAMACGLPVIACAGSGAAEVVMPGENGFLVPADDVDALTASLRTLLKNEQERTRLARQAREYAVEHADSEKMLTRLASFYTSVAQRCKGTAA